MSQMRVSEENLSRLPEYGFVATSEDDEDEDNGSVMGAEFKYEIGHSRRGQFYYILVTGGRVTLYASEPDGSGGQVRFPDIVVKLVQDGIFILD